VLATPDPSGIGLSILDITYLPEIKGSFNSIHCGGSPSFAVALMPIVQMAVLESLQSPSHTA